MGRGCRTLLNNALAVAALAAGPLLVTSALTPTAAHAQATVFAQPLVELIPMGEIAADGATPVTLRVIALGTDGAPLTGLSGKLSLGTVNEKITDLGGGVYEATLTPAAVTAAGLTSASFKAKGDGGSFNKDFLVRLVPANNRAITIVSNPPNLVLGQDASATLTFTLTGAAADAAEQGMLDVRSSSGTVANLTALGGGRYTALFTAPSQLFPHNALITVVDKRNPARSYGAAAIPMTGKASFPVVGLPGSMVMMKVADREFGPIQADASGRAQIPIVVPPGVNTATVTSVAGAQRSEEPMDLKIPVTKRVELFPNWAAIPSDNTQRTAVRAFVTTPTGQPDTAAKVRFSTTAGAVGEARHEGAGVYVAEFTPPYGAGSSAATVQVTVDDGSGAQSDSLTVNLAGARPSGLTLTPEPAILDPQAASFQLFARLAGKDGLGLSGSGIRIEAAGAAQQGTTRDLGNGDYQATFLPEGKGVIEVLGAVRATAGGNPLRHILVLPARDVVAADGVSTTALAVLTLDAWGHPVPGVPVQLKVSQGDAATPATVTTDDAGIAFVPMTSGRAAGAVRISATGGGRTGDGLVIQGPTSIALKDLPVAGTGSTQALVSSWDNLFKSVTIAREGTTGVVAASPFSAGPAGAVARLSMVAEPASVAPGGVVLLKLQAMDAQNRPVPGQQMQFVASAGIVGPLQEMGGGNYQAALTLPPGVTPTDVKVTAVTASGIAALISVPVSAGAVAAGGWGAPGPDAGTPVTPTPAQPVKEPKAPREAGDFPWMRVQGGFLSGLYSYQQAPSTAGGPLYSEKITVGGQITEPAGAVGFFLDARGYLPTFEYIGFDAGFRSNRWSMNLSEGFDEPIPDWLNNFNLTAIGRYPFEIGEKSRVHVGARLGFDINDFIYFTQEDTGDGNFDILYQQLVVFDTSVGAEIGAEFGPGFGIVGYEASFTDFSALYSSDIDVELGVSIGGTAFVSGRMGWLNRSTPLYNADKQEVGSIRDTFTSFGLGVGAQF